MNSGPVASRRGNRLVPLACPITTGGYDSTRGRLKTALNRFRSLTALIRSRAIKSIVALVKLRAPRVYETRDAFVGCGGIFVALWGEGFKWINDQLPIYNGSVFEACNRIPESRNDE